MSKINLLSDMILEKDYNVIPYANVLKNDYEKSINVLIDTFGKYALPYLNKFYHSAKSYNRSQMIELSDYDIKNVMLEYSKNRPNIKTVIFWNLENREKVLHLLRLKNNVNCYMSITVTKNFVLNLIAEIFNCYDYDVLNKKYIDMNFHDDNNIKITYVMFESNDLNINYNLDIFKNHHLIIDKHYKVIEINSIFFSDETINYLNCRSLENLCSEQFKQSLKYLNIFKESLKENFDQLESYNILLTDEATMLLYGIRTIDKIQSIIIDSEKKEIINNLYFNKVDRKYPFVKMYVLKDEKMNSLTIDEELSKTHEEIQEDISKNIKTYYSLIYKEFFVHNDFIYWQGIKFYNIFTAISHKTFRYRTIDHLDFLALINIHLKIDNNILLFNDLYNKSDENIKYYLSKFLFRDRIRIPY